jgi:thiol-disulfide isomerase/thioredoxin
MQRIRILLTLKNHPMKAFYLYVLAVALLACTNKQKDYVSIAGTVKNSTEKNLLVQSNAYQKEIEIQKDGSFKDTLHLKALEDTNSYNAHFYALRLGKQQTLAYLQNGFDLTVHIDGDDFEISGKGAQNTNYIKEKIALNNEQTRAGDLMAGNLESFEERLAEIKERNQMLLDKYDGLDGAFAAAEATNNSKLYEYLENQYTASKSTQKGSLSPSFSNYKNHAGGVSSLEDFKGKYVYLDIWATWCGPCIQQIPFLNELETKYHGKNIAFVSISIDQINAENKWRQMVQNKNMTGIQLFSNGDQSFVQAYQISGIPRFILIDPEGKIVDANAPRPSDPSLQEIFKDLKI